MFQEITNQDGLYLLEVGCVLHELVITSLLAAEECERSIRVDAVTSDVELLCVEQLFVRMNEEMTECGMLAHLDSPILLVQCKFPRQVE